MHLHLLAWGAASCIPQEAVCSLGVKAHAYRGIGRCTGGLSPHGACRMADCVQSRQ